VRVELQLLSYIFELTITIDVPVSPSLFLGEGHYFIHSFVLGDESFEKGFLV
jgi:hypothetical protein